MSDKESQKDEICALESIYNEEEFQVHEENGLTEGIFYAYIDLPSGFKVVYKDLRQEESDLQEFPVKYLPPLCLRFSLPEDYPSRSSPAYTLSCQWLRNDKIMSLCVKLDNIWKENEYMEVLFLWTQFLKEETLNYLEITDALDVSSLETTFLKHEEYKQARRARQLEAEARKREEEEKAAQKSANESVKETNDSSSKSCISDHPRMKPRGGRQRWQGRDRYNQRNARDERGTFERRYHDTGDHYTRSSHDQRNNSRVMFFDNRSKRFISRPTRNRTENKLSYESRDNNSHQGSDQKVLGSNDQTGRSSKCDTVVVDEKYSDSKESKDADGATQDLNLNSETKETESGANDNESEAAVCDERKPGITNRPRMSVVKLLREFDEARQRTEFSRNFYTCKICFQDKKGLQCTYFEGCGHVFCKSCIADYFEVRIKDGTVKNIYCPEEKCTTEALPSQVQELVSAELFSRYDSVLLSALLDTMEDVLYCPRPACQYPVAMEPGEKMATCPSCNYAFCVFCKMVYHGIEPCRFRAHEKRILVEEYSNASDERRIEMEQRYGKKQLQTLVDTYLSENWLDSNSKKCPKCSSAIEKSDGCNKMVCWKCNTFFCWLCEERLDPKSPYMHFNNPTSKCYNLLFHGVPLSDDEDDDDRLWWVPPGNYLQHQGN